MSPESRCLAGILLVVYPTVIYGGVSLLYLLTSSQSGYSDNELRRSLWAAGHGHAGLLLLISLVVLRYVDEVNLPNALKIFIRHATPVAAILVPVAFFLSVLPKDATEPNGLIYLAYIGAAMLALSLLTLEVGLLRQAKT